MVSSRVGWAICAAWSVLVAALVFVACGDTTIGIVAGPVGLDKGDASTDAFGTDAWQPTDSNTRGSSCATACEGELTCSLGTCTCLGGGPACGTQCPDLSSSPTHCGRCGNACSANQVCNNGICAATCSSGLSNCYGACIDLLSEPSHCGGCSTVCAGGEVCTAGVCSCPGGLVACGGNCVESDERPVALWHLRRRV